MNGNEKLIQSLNKINLNLMLVFYTLYKEKHLSKAAESLCLSQPAVSHSLKKLRTLFNDELFLKSVDGMQPTPIADLVADTIEKGLFYFDEAINKTREFDLNTSQREFRIGLTDYMNKELLPLLTQYIAPKLSDVRFNMVPVQISRIEETENILRTKNLDIAIAELEYIPKGNGCDFLYEEAVGCVGDSQIFGHQPTMTLDSFLQSPHVALSHREDVASVTNKTLKRLGLSRKIIAQSAHIGPLRETLPNTNVVSVITEKAAKFVCEGTPLKFYHLPFEMPPFQVCMLWDIRKENDPAMTWLRNLIKQLIPETK